MPLHPSLLKSPAPIASGPDAEIIAACNKFAALEASRYEPDFPSEEWPKEFLAAYEAAYEAVLNGRATTLEGFIARARTLAMYLEPDEARQWHWCMVEALLEDMLRLPEEEAKEPAAR